MPRSRILSGISIALVSALSATAVAFAGAGDSDATFGSGGVTQIATGNANRSSAAAALTQSGKLVLAGQAFQSTGDGDRGEIAITRLNADGSRDTTFGSAGQTLIAAGTGDAEALAAALTADGKIVVAGTAVNGAKQQIAVARLLPTGLPDPSFGSGGLVLFDRGNQGVARARGIVAQPDGSLIVASNVQQAGATVISMDRVSSAGVPDGAWHSLTSAGTNTDTEASGLTRLPDGTFAVTGSADAVSGTQLLVSRYSAANGALTAGWGTPTANGIALRDLGDGSSAIGNALTVSGSRIIAAGSAADDGSRNTFLAAFSATNGLPDPTFGSGGSTLTDIGSAGQSEANAVTIAADGSIVVAGDAVQENQGTNNSQFLAARYTSNGILDPTFAPTSTTPGTSLVAVPGVPAIGTAAAIQDDGKIIVGGRLEFGPLDETLAAARYCSNGSQSCASAAAPGAPGSPLPSNPADAVKAVEKYECGQTVVFSIISAEGCVKPVDGHFEATGRLKVNGIIMQPEAGGTLILDPQKLKIYVKGVGKKVGTLSASVGSITLFDNLPFDITLPSASVPSFSLPNLPTSGKASLFGFPIQGNADLNLVNGGVELKLQVTLPKLFGTVSGQVTLRADTKTGLHVDGLQITAKTAALGPLTINDLLISYTDSTKLWTGQATVHLKPIPYGAGGAVQIQNGQLKSVVATAEPNVPLGEGVFLSKISFGISTDPLTILGGIGFSVGPPVGGAAAVKIEGNLKLSFPGKPLAKLEISSNAFCQVASCSPGEAQSGGDGLSVVGIPLAGYHFSADTDGQIAFGGNINLNLEIASLSASVDGWIDGVKAFNLQGKGTVCVFVVACVGAEGVVSSEGMAVCGYANLLAVKISIGVGIKWPFDVDVMAKSCDIGPYAGVHATGARAARLSVDGTRFQAPTGPQSISFDPKKDYALLRVTGDSAPPLATLTGPDGATVDTPAAPSPGLKTDRFMVFKDYDKHQTTFVVPKPGAKAWTLTPDAGSAAITAVEQADPLPPVKVKAKVSGSAYQRKLAYDIASIPGQSVQFAEVGGGVTHVLGVTTKSKGSLSFVPRDGSKGKRKIVATVSQDGHPRTQLTAATYSAPARRLPSKLKSVKATRSKSSLKISWPKSANAAVFRVMVTVSDGRTLMFELPSKTRSLVVPDLLSSDSVKVAVRGVTDALRTGPATNATVKAVPAKKPKATTTSTSKTTKKKK